MALQEIDFGTVNDVNTIARVKDDTLGPNTSTDFELEIKARRASHRVDIYVLLLPLGSPLSIDPPGSDLASKVEVNLVPGQSEKIQMLIKNDSSGASSAKYTLICTTFVDGAFSAVNVFSVPPKFHGRVGKIMFRPWRLIALMAAMLFIAAMLSLVLPNPWMAVILFGSAALFLGFALSQKL